MKFDIVHSGLYIAFGVVVGRLLTDEAGWIEWAQYTCGILIMALSDIRSRRQGVHDGIEIATNAMNEVFAEKQIDFRLPLPERK